MILDAEAAPDGAAFHADVVVVGAGAAGIPAAAELERAGLRVLLVETGSLKKRREADDLSKGAVADQRHGPLDRYRVRVFGGTTSVWGGRVAPLDEIDLTARDYASAPGWPLSRADLDAPYRTAHLYLHAGPFDYDADSALDRPRVPRDAAELTSESFHHKMLWRFSEPVDLGRAWRDRFRRSPTVTVLLNSTCVALTTSEDGARVTSCEIRTLEGNNLRATATAVVLACGGLEVTRLLLASRSERHPDGLGNSYGNVGRYYSSHLAGSLGPFRWLGRTRLVGTRYERDRSGVYVRRTLSLRPGRQTSEGLLNFRASISVPPLTNPEHGSAVLSAAYLAKRFLLRKIPPEFDPKYGRRSSRNVRNRHLLNVAAHLPELVGFAPWWVAKRIVPKRKIPSMEPRIGSTFFLHFDAEQSPRFDSRITLLDERDALDMPRLHVAWSASDEDVDSLARAYELLNRDLAEAGIAQADETKEAARERIGREIGVGSHHIGTTRMSSSPSKGVTDAECRVHGLSNVYVASSSVFPSTGVVNPTLTIVAIAVRVTRTICHELGRA